MTYCVELQKTTMLGYNHSHVSPRQAFCFLIQIQILSLPIKFKQLKNLVEKLEIKPTA